MKIYEKFNIISFEFQISENVENEAFISLYDKRVAKEKCCAVILEFFIHTYLSHFDFRNFLNL